MNTISLDDELALLHERICPALDHPVRMKIIYLLNEKAMNVGELTEVMGIPQSSVSRHLRALRELLTQRRERILIKRVNGNDIFTSEWREHLIGAGFRLTPSGLR